MKKVLTILLLTIGLSCYSQCDSLDNKIMIDFLSEKLHESDVQNEKLKYQLQTARVKIFI